MSTYLTKNFLASEFACNCGCKKSDMNPEFMLMMQDLRDVFAKPMTITSGLRCQSWNHKIKGKNKSLHLVGRAADIHCANSNEKFEIVNLAIALGFRGIGINGTFVHIDNRESLPVLWTY